MTRIAKQARTRNLMALQPVTDVPGPARRLAYIDGEALDPRISTILLD